LHAGCDASYNGRYTEAQAIFTKLIAEHQGKDHDGARMMLGKARQRLALLKVEQNNLDERSFCSPRCLKVPIGGIGRTASHWLQRVSRYRAAKQALLSCGADALAYTLEKDGLRIAAKARCARTCLRRCGGTRWRTLPN